MRWAALLRGVNLGKRQLKSADLAATVEGLGFTEVRTLLASGNVVFTAPGARAEALEQELHDALVRQTALRSDIFIRTPTEMDAIVAANPFPDVAKERPSQLVVMFHRTPVDPAPLERLMAGYDGPERVEPIGREFFVDFPDGQGRSNLPAAFTKAKLASLATARNWNTVLRIRDAL